MGRRVMIQKNKSLFQKSLKIIGIIQVLNSYRLKILAYRAFTYSKLTTETLEQGVKYVQS